MKINRAVLNKLIDEFNAQMKLCEEMEKMEGTPKENLVVELSKGMGLVSAASYEAAALMNDIMKEVKINSDPNVSDNIFDVLDSVVPQVKTAKNN